MKILLLADNSKESTRALEVVRCRDWPMGTEFLVLGVVPRRYLPPPPPSMLEVLAGGGLARPDEVARARVSVKLAVEALASKGWVARGNVRRGRPATELLAEARAWNADLIVVGRVGSAPSEMSLAGRGGLSSVMPSAPCSVEVIQEEREATSRGAGLAALRAPVRRSPPLHTPS